MAAVARPPSEFALRRADGARRVRRTLMFTDIVGSTALMSNLGDERWTDVLRWHDAVLRHHFVEHFGCAVKQMGDGFLAAFEEACYSLSCALGIQQTMAHFERENGIPLRIRIGVHRAEVIHIEGDYTGRGVHEAARIAMRARAGEILTSVETLAASRFPYEAHQARSITLRGLPDPVTVVSIRARPRPRSRPLLPTRSGG